MNRLLLILLMLVIGIGCKNNSEVVRINGDLIGKWTVQSNSMIYFDKAGEKEYEEALNPTGVAKDISFMKGARAKIVTQDSADVLKTPYSLKQENKAIYIELGETDIFDCRVWELTEVSATDMTWKANFSNIKYEDKDTGEILEAPQAELTLKFNKYDK
ncbi:hypothetical protein SAMN04488101_11692 [Pedobacter nyackensis]|uniref:Lipocalin-like domain-containing protein n=2 Tax=Pedobacter nyackensis TaxID=475255 RepID=A0A1W2EW49_9SPHI|nr:hypothetical protein SAMN04488101_11692 [Pedobacter nyackensis]